MKEGIKKLKSQINEIDAELSKLKKKYELKYSDLEKRKMKLENKMNQYVLDIFKDIDIEKIDAERLRKLIEKSTNEDVDNG